MTCLRQGRCRQGETDVVLFVRPCWLTLGHQLSKCVGALLVQNFSFKHGRHLHQVFCTELGPPFWRNLGLSLEYCYLKLVWCPLSSLLRGRSLLYQLHLPYCRSLWVVRIQPFSLPTALQRWSWMHSLHLFLDLHHLLLSQKIGMIHPHFQLKLFVSHRWRCSWFSFSSSLLTVYDDLCIPVLGLRVIAFWETLCSLDRTGPWLVFKFIILESS
mgnify:CR=1 FL=1